MLAIGSVMGTRGALGRALRQPGAEVAEIGAAARRRYRDGVRVWLAPAAVLLCLLGYVSYRSPGLHAFAMSAGGVSAALPWSTEIVRLPGSTFLPTPQLPLPAAMLQLLIVVALAELLVGRRAALVVAAGAQVLSTLAARLLLADVSFELLRGSPDQTHLLDTGPSAVTTALGAFLLTRRRAYSSLTLLAAGLLAADLMQNDLDGREHLIALLFGAFAATVSDTWSGATARPMVALNEDLI